MNAYTLDALSRHGIKNPAVLTRAGLRGADLNCASLAGADLSRADLAEADLRWADLRGANLSGVELAGANLNWANLSGAKGLPLAREWVAQLEQDELGVIVYKRIGKTRHPASPDWKIEPGAILTENVDTSRTVECGCGVNFGTRRWCNENYTGADLWKCRIRWIDLAGVVVPYNTDGKARCARLELLERIEG